jgi:heparan-alpha-glucosaminide N-acetyltransferase
VLVFLAIYYLADVQHQDSWAALVKPAGSNTLLTYLLPDLFYFSCGTLYAVLPWKSGWPGVVRSVVFTACVRGASAVLTRKRIRMQL